MNQAQPAAPVGPASSPIGAATSYDLIVGATLVLVFFGLVMVLSASSVDLLQQGNSPYLIAIAQAQYALVGLALFWIASRIPVATYVRLAAPAFAATLLLQLLVFSPLGIGHGGNRNWLAIGPVTGQPAEVLKIGLALWLGMILARRQHRMTDWRQALVPAVPGAAVAIGLVLLGFDVGTAMVMALLVGGALFVAGVPLRVFAVAGTTATGAFLAMAAVSTNRNRRISDWLSGECDVTAGCYQSLQGTRALASGGWTGAGLGQSRQKWSYLPEAENDFIFAIIGEELGLAGTLLVLSLLAVLGYALFRVIGRHTDPFARITTGGIALWLLGQALVNIGTVIGLAPVIGVPLPLVSAGGSALIATLIALGIVAAFARTEPGAAEALAARPGVLRRSVAVLGRVR